VGKLISAALIVRNEENHVGACLQSVVGLVDDIVVVDTGSFDRSREIAAVHGARVFDYEWRDDFAAARNHAIDQATGDWILYIDADERVRAYDRRILESELADPNLCACTVRFHPRTGFTAYPEHRLFRRNPRIRFRSAIHETIMPDLKRIVAAGGESIGSSGLTIDHLGYDGDQSHKAERNLGLLRKQIQFDPDRVYLWWHLGSVYRDLLCLAEAEAAWSEGIKAARRNPVRGPDVALCFIELAKLRLLEGEEAQALIREAKELQPENLVLRWLEARELVAVGQYAEALSIFEALAAVDAATLLADVSYDRRILGAWALAEAGYCAFRLGCYPESERCYRLAEALEPDCVEFRIKRQLAGIRAAGTVSIRSQSPAEFADRNVCGAAN
jgi:glycosyltransferase involved in cell wall biosynthesis